MQSDHHDDPPGFDHLVRPAAPRNSRSRSSTLRRRTATLSIVAVVLLSVAAYFPLTLLWPLAPAVMTGVSAATVPGQPAAIALPGFGASAITALGYPAAVGKAGSTKQLPIASISKVVTALVALSAKPLAAGEQGPTIRFGNSDAALFAKYTAMNGKAEPMPAGSSLSEFDLLRVVLIASANNYADKLASWSFGSESSFLSATKSWLNAHRLDHTTIVEPTGISQNNTSTPADLIVIGKLALANPVLATIVATKSISLPSVGSFSNTNALLGRDGVDGIKTGTLDRFGSSLLFTADYAIGGKSIRIIGAIVGAADHATLYAGVRALLRSVEHGFHLVTVAKAGQAFAAFHTAWNARAQAVATTTQKVVVWSDTPIRSVLATAPVITAGKGSPAGSVTFTAGEEVVVVPLALKNAIVAPSAGWRLSHPALILKP